MPAAAHSFPGHSCQRLGPHNLAEALALKAHATGRRLASWGLSGGHMPDVTWSPFSLPCCHQSPRLPSQLSTRLLSSRCRRGSNNGSLGKSGKAPQGWSPMRGSPPPPPGPGVQSAAGNPNFPAQLSGQAGFRVSLLTLTPSHCLPLPRPPK